MNLKKVKKICIIALCGIAAAALFMGTGIITGMRLCEKQALPPGGAQTAVKAVTGKAITISDLRIYDQSLNFMMTSPGPGQSRASIARPDKWGQQNNMLLVGLSGSFTQHHGRGALLPGASITYLRRVWGNLHVGPSLAVHAVDAETFSLSLNAQAGLSW